MKLNTLMLIKAIVVFVFGISFIFMPVKTMSYYGLALNPGGALMTQLFGASFLLLGIILWSSRNALRSETALRAIVLAIFVGDLIGFIVALLAQINGVMNVLGWANVALYFLLALGFGYFQFSRQKAA